MSEPEAVERSLGIRRLNQPAKNLQLARVVFVHLLRHTGTDEIANGEVLAGDIEQARSRGGRG